eukprot:5753507-Ditylum_brightwellii.AAC.1
MPRKAKHSQFCYHAFKRKYYCKHYKAGGDVGDDKEAIEVKDDGQEEDNNGVKKDGGERENGEVEEEKEEKMSVLRRKRTKRAKRREYG